MARRRYEEGLHIACVQALRAMSPTTLFWHVPNGGLRTKAQAAMFARMGVLAGVPDLEIITIDGKPVWVELKALKGRLTVGQELFKEHVESIGLRVFVVRSTGEFLSLINQLKKEGALP